MGGVGGFSKDGHVGQSAKLMIIHHILVCFYKTLRKARHSNVFNIIMAYGKGYHLWTNYPLRVLN